MRRSACFAPVGVGFSYRIQKFKEWRRVPFGGGDGAADVGRGGAMRPGVAIGGALMCG